jgi:uncharacterized membrane protein YccC
MAHQRPRFDRPRWTTSFPLRWAGRRVADPGLGSLKSAVRAAMVMPAAFAVADQAIGNPQTATFAAFGSFAMLVLVEFTGPWRARLAAYLGLAGTGAALVVVGTLCSRDPWLAAAAMALVGFTILFAGIVSSYVAVGATPAMLAFILPVSIPASPSAIPARLAGWGLASAAAICAVMLLWPSRAGTELRSSAARACLALADLADAKLRRDSALIAHRVQLAHDAVSALRRQFLATPHRPTAPAGATAALAALIDELDWLRSFLMGPDQPASLDLCRSENGELLTAVAGVLRSSAERLDGAEEWPDTDRLERARDAVAGAVAQRLGQERAANDDAAWMSALEPSFRLRALSYSARQVAVYALIATGAPAPDLQDPQEARWHPTAPLRRSALRASWQLAARHMSFRSVWFRNSLRGATALTVAVFVAQRTGLQHAFWVVLGTLSVLRSNALSTGASILRALAGTAAGILLGSALVIAIGTREPVLWAVLPLAVLLAAYAPRAISFAAGQAGFTIVLFVIFNLIQPVGWRVGLVRIEDVATGFAVSLGVGLLFWPRGAAAVMRENLAAAYARGADYFAAAAHQLVRGADPTSSERAAQAAYAASDRLDDAYRQYIAERPDEKDVENLGGLVAGATRLRRAAQSLSALSQLTDGSHRLDCAGELESELHAVRSWYMALGRALAQSNTVPAPHVPNTASRQRILRCVREAVAGGQGPGVRPALALLWASQHLDNLRALEDHLGRRSVEG